MNQIHEMEEAIAALAMFLTTCDPRNPNTERVAAAVEPIAVWYEEYMSWKKKRDAKDAFRKFMAEHR